MLVARASNMQTMAHLPLLHYHEVMIESLQLAHKTILFPQCSQEIRGKKHVCKGEIIEVAHVPRNNYMTSDGAGRLGRRQTKSSVTSYWSFLTQGMLILRDVYSSETSCSKSLLIWMCYGSRYYHCISNVFKPLFSSLFKYLNSLES